MTCIIWEFTLLLLSDNSSSLHCTENEIPQWSENSVISSILTFVMYLRSGGLSKT